MKKKNYCPQCGRDDSKVSLEGDYCGYCNEGDQPKEINMNYKNLTDKELVMKYREYEDAIESGQIDPWMDEQLGIMMDEIKCRGLDIPDHNF